MPNLMYNSGKMELTTNTSWTGSVIQIALVSSTYSENADHNSLTDITASELQTTNYVRITLASRTQTEDDTNDWVSFDAADPTWTSLGPPTNGATVHGAVIFRSGSTSGTSPLICFLDLTNTQVNGSNVTINFPAAGIFTLV